MPKSPPRPCTKPGCGRLVHDGSGRCEAHPKPAWSKPETATKRTTGRKLQTMRAQLFTANPLCVMCEAEGRVTEATQRDHIVPLAEGGADDESNVQGLCRECHDIKSKEESARGRGGALRVSLLPDFLPRPTVPVVVVCGPPGSGKTTYVTERAAASDLVLDVDVMAAKLSGKPLYHASYDERMTAIRLRNDHLLKLGRPVSYAKAWLIVTAGTQRQRDHWRNKYGDLVIMPTSKAECIQRINQDERRPLEQRRRAIEAVNVWE
jgi:5-methylcytosine-specific restriction protein A